VTGPIEVSREPVVVRGEFEYMSVLDTNFAFEKSKICIEN
jgi:hypothetical protein